MATPDHTPRVISTHVLLYVTFHLMLLLLVSLQGRGYDSSLSFFYHCNDYYNFTVDDDFGNSSRG
jgi:hypothetical protein